MRKVLNVAEKPSVAKQITQVLSRGQNVERVNGPARYNPVSRFQTVLRGEEVTMLFTSVRGHIMEVDFIDGYSNWNDVPPGALLKARTVKKVAESNKDVAENLRKFASGVDELILWLDCDREGEGIAFEVIQICSGINPRIKISRATFSAVTERDVERALETLGPPNKHWADAVEARQELDLRIGTSLTRLMTLRFKRRFNMPHKVISYGPCQFPTLGFVVSRWVAMQLFVPENFWTLSLKIKVRDQSVALNWSRYRVYDKALCLMLYQSCILQNSAKILHVDARQTKKKKPVPMNTIQMTKLGATHLRLPAHQIMSLAESLYNKGYLSYPRTETDSFSSTIDVKGLVALQVGSPDWGNYASHLINEGGYEGPRSGSRDDSAHPPIHPVKRASRVQCQSDAEWDLYKLIVCHFLAVCSKDAVGWLSTVEVAVGHETFKTSGLTIKERNFLDIWGAYENWQGRFIADMQVGEKWPIEELILTSGQTTSPSLLSEVELMGLMDKFGVGTDATMHEHIRVIQERQYAERISSTGGVQLFKPTVLGLALFQGYKRCSSELTKPDLRAETERAIAGIASGQLDKDQVLTECITRYIQLFNTVGSNLMSMETSLAAHFVRNG